MGYVVRPYLNYPGTTREALEFYQGIFGGELTVTTYGSMHALPEDSPSLDKVMHSELVTAHFALAAADAIAETPIEVVYGNSVSLAIMADADSLEDLTTAFQQLAEGGTVIMELQEQMWGAVYGSLVDRYGVSWMVNIATATA
ncbi:MAG: VOC family protein [Brachybacterium sp.]|nr:VOC family protein [Brachybacterium sp.]